MEGESAVSRGTDLVGMRSGEIGRGIAKSRSRKMVPCGSERSGRCGGETLAATAVGQSGKRGCTLYLPSNTPRLCCTRHLFDSAAVIPRLAVLSRLIEMGDPSMNLIRS